MLIGETAGWLGQSVYLSVIAGREEGAPPPVDLAIERRNGDFVRGLILSGTVDTVHDLSDGGLAVALAEMAMAGGIGLVVDAPWPKADPAMLVDDTVTLPIQINGKRRAEIEVPKDMPKDQIEALVLADETVQRFMEGLPVKKLIVVPGRIVNVVV